MALIEKWSPVTDLERLRHEFDELFDQFGFHRRGLIQDWQSTMTHPAIESYTEGDQFTVRVELPGVDPKAVDIKVAGGILTIRGSREQKQETIKRDFIRHEIRYGSFERSISLPEGMKAEDLKATYRDGVLQLTAPMPKEAVSKEIKIQVEGEAAKKPGAEK
ncbi:MAG TPA: Hsp20/alpha crystallin family protein [Candidatus Binataceae bacterium]|nr:Hsp20/alpha crystallin family protein [Candidatus Binataceae bacterium]